MITRIKKSDIPEVKIKLLKQQNYECGICGVDLTNIQTKNLCLDHCHVAGYIRKVLCRNCNGIEGKIFNLCRRGQREGNPIEFANKLINYWNLPTTALFHPLHKTEDEKRLDRNAKARKARAKAKAIKNLKG